MQWLVSVLQMYSPEPASHNILKFVNCVILAGILECRYRFIMSLTFVSADTVVFLMGPSFYDDSGSLECRYPYW